MASFVLGSLSIPLQSVPLSSRFSFSESETLRTSFSYSISRISISASASSSSSSSLPLVYCGRGDKKTAKGKRFKHSYGNARPRNKKKGRGPPRVPVPPSGPKKDRFDDNEKIELELDESLFTS